MDKQSKSDRLREVVVYIIFGLLVTVVNMAVFQCLEWLLRPLLGDHSYLLNNVLAFIVAVSFAFFTNKIFVFRQKSWEPRIVLREASTFIAARLLSFGMDYLLTFVFFDLVWPLISSWFTPLWQSWGLLFFDAKGVYRFVTKWGLIGLLVIVSNYFISKYIIFKTPPMAGEESVLDCAKEASK